MKKTLVFLSLILLLSGVRPLLAEAPVLRVLISGTMHEAELAFEGKVNVFNDAGEKVLLRGDYALSVKIGEDMLILADRRNGSKVLLRGTSLRLENTAPDGNIEIKQVPFGNGWWWSGEKDRRYQGDLEFYINRSNHLDVINVLNIENYLYGVIPAEIGTDAPLEALKAQAVCARSEALTGLATGKYAGAHHDLTSDVMSQVYHGIGEANPAVREAVDKTRGEVLTYADTVISAYYSSNCGGHTEDIENVWPERSGHRPYLSGHPDADKAPDTDLRQAENVRRWIEGAPDTWCRTNGETPEWAADNFRWKRSVDAGELSEAVAKKHTDIGRVYDIVPLGRGKSGRIYDILFIGDSGHCRIRGELSLRRLWDNPLKSSCFVVDKIGPTGRPASFILSGAGWGHGVGMCQSGAIAMAAAGKSYRDILTHYFRGTQIQQQYK